LAAPEGRRQGADPVSSQVRTSCVSPGVRPGKISGHQRPKQSTMLCMVLYFGIRRLPIFPDSAHMVAVRCRRSGFLQLPVLPPRLDLPAARGALYARCGGCEQLRFAASCTAGAHRRCVSSQVRTSCVSPEVRPGKISGRQRPKQSTMLCMVLYFGIRRLPIFPTQFRNGRAASCIKHFLALPCSLDVRLPVSATGGGRLHPISSQVRTSCVSPEVRPGKTNSCQKSN